MKPASRNLLESKDSPKRFKASPRTLKSKRSRDPRHVGSLQEGLHNTIVCVSPPIIIIKQMNLKMNYAITKKQKEIRLSEREAAGSIQFGLLSWKSALRAMCPY